MYVTKVTLEGIPPLEEEVHFDCDEHVNLFIGPNASGKSTILRILNGLNFLLLGAHYDEDWVVVETRGNMDEPPIACCFLHLSDGWPVETYNSPEDMTVPLPFPVPVLYIPATRVSLRGRDIFTKTIEPPENVEDIDVPLDQLFDTESGVFHGRYVEWAIDWLREEIAPTPPLHGDRGGGWTLPRSINRNRQNQLRKVLEVGYSCAKDICREVIHDNIPHAYVDRDYYDEKAVHYGMGIGTTDNILGEPLYAGTLSSGTQGTLLWVWALALKMASHYGWEEGWEKKPAILLIDEIENHLHPTWQRRVIPALLDKDHFPQLQIFATTHSPFMVAGLKAGQVHLLKRDPNGTVTATTNERDVIGWTADEILRTMMGVDEPTDQLTVDRANRLRQLREKETLTPEEESELNELRRKVNEELLSKAGLLEDQRKRYAELMERFLRSRQSDLTQDGE